MRMNERLIKITDVKVIIGGKDILDIPQLQLYENERIGIVGDNGSGKSTLLKLLAGQVEPDQGQIQREAVFGYFPQGGRAESPAIDGETLAMMSHLAVPHLEHPDLLSGGENAKFRLSQVLADYQPGLLLDEPTTHLDRQGIGVLTEELRYYYGTLVVVSHDRQFLNQVAETIWEVAEGKITVYKGNYDAYHTQKEQDQATQLQAHQQYLKEKQRLETSLRKKQEQVKKAARVSKKKQQQQIRPDRLSSSKQKDTVEKNLQKSAKALAGRMERLTATAAPQTKQTLRFPTLKSLAIHNPFPVMGMDLHLSVGDKVILDKTNFQFGAGKKIAILGENGAGKTTLLQHILQGGAGLQISPKVRFAVYGQLDYVLDKQQPLIGYLQERSEFSEPFVRSILHNLGFTPEYLQTPVQQLSGGQRTRLALATAFLEPANVLVLDEPTNFIDLATIQVLEELLLAYPGMVLFTSHDESFVDRVADEKWHLGEGNLTLEWHRG